MKAAVVAKFVTSAECSDADCVHRAKGGDLEAFEVLLCRHEQRVYSLALKMLRHKQSAEDVTQEAFLKAVEHLDDFREESSFSTWILRIATNAALKIIRKQGGLDTLSLEEVPETSGRAIPHPDYIPDWRNSPEQLVQINEMHLLLEEALGRLDEKHRLVFLLRDVEGLPVKETAAALGLSEANTKVRLLRARLQMRTHLEFAFGDPSLRRGGRPPC
jgi:RNA polymerase sigma-70 factor (ECF subfamily)